LQPVQLTKEYAHYQVRDPSLFKDDTIRTQDIGRHKHSKLRLGALKQSGRLVVQSVLIDRKDYEAGTRVVLHHGQPRIVKGAT
jgi:hypothetical protein